MNYPFRNSQIDSAAAGRSRSFYARTAVIVAAVAVAVAVVATAFIPVAVGVALAALMYGDVARHIVGHVLKQHCRV